MKKYHFWCNAHGEEVIEFDDDADEHDIKEACSEWIESLLDDSFNEYVEEEQQLEINRDCGYYED